MQKPKLLLHQPNIKRKIPEINIPKFQITHSSE